jgi:hypothetical protein
MCQHVLPIHSECILLPKRIQLHPTAREVKMKLQCKNLALFLFAHTMSSLKGQCCVDCRASHKESPGFVTGRQEPSAIPFRVFGSMWRIYCEHCCYKMCILTIRKLRTHFHCESISTLFIALYQWSGNFTLHFLPLTKSYGFEGQGTALHVIMNWLFSTVMQVDRFVWYLGKLSCYMTSCLSIEHPQVCPMHWLAKLPTFCLLVLVNFVADVVGLEQWCKVGETSLCRDELSLSDRRLRMDQSLLSGSRRMKRVGEWWYVQWYRHWFICEYAGQFSHNRFLPYPIQFTIYQ